MDLGEPIEDTTTEDHGVEQVATTPESDTNNNDSEEDEDDEQEDDDDEPDDDVGDENGGPLSSNKIYRGDSIDISETRGEEDIDESEDEGSVKSSATDHTPASKNKRSKRRGSSIGGGGVSSSALKRVPSVAGLTIPFRTIKKAMKLDPDTPIVQNEAAIMTTIAVELFVKKLATASLDMAKSRGRQNVRYEDIAEARSKNKAMAFLEPLLP